MRSQVLGLHPRSEDAKRGSVAVLYGGQIDSPVAGVRAVIVAEMKCPVCGGSGVQACDAIPAPKSLPVKSCAACIGRGFRGSEDG